MRRGQEAHGHGQDGRTCHGADNCRPPSEAVSKLATKQCAEHRAQAVCAEGEAGRPIPQTGADQVQHQERLHESAKLVDEHPK